MPIVYYFDLYRAIESGRKNSLYKWDGCPLVDGQGQRRARGGGK